MTKCLIGFKLNTERGDKYLVKKTFKPKDCGCEAEPAIAICATLVTCDDKVVTLPLAILVTQELNKEVKEFLELVEKKGGAVFKDMLDNAYGVIAEIPDKTPNEKKRIPLSSSPED